MVTTMLHQGRGDTEQTEQLNGHSQGMGGTYCAQLSCLHTCTKPLQSISTNENRAEDSSN